MNTNGSHESKERHDAIVRYARLYAQNRNLPWVFVGAWSALTSACLACGLVLLWSGYSNGRFWLAGLGILLALVALVLMLWAGGMRAVWEWGTLFYRADGYVSRPSPRGAQPGRLRQFLIVAATVIGFEVVLYGHDALVQRGTLPLRWTLPLSALYMVPFLLVCFYGLYRDKGLWFLLSPVLYVLYALLALLGLPVTISQQPFFMISSAALIAMVVAMLIGECSSRLALSKLRRTARMAPHADEG